MIVERSDKDDLFKLPGEFPKQNVALLNPVNLHGGFHHGGLAGIFARQYPTAQKIYDGHCREGALTEGTVTFAVLDGLTNGCVAFFPTMNRGRHEGDLRLIHLGMAYLYRKLTFTKVNLPIIGIPALGCGIGGLQWEDVYALIKFFWHDSKTEVHVYPPRPYYPVPTYQHKPKQPVAAK